MTFLILTYFVIGFIASYFVYDYYCKDYKKRSRSEPGLTWEEYSFKEDSGFSSYLAIFFWPIVVMIAIGHFISKYIKKRNGIKFLLFISILVITSCKSDKVSHEDKDYLYIWKYKFSGDSVLCKYNKPRIVEYKVSGGRHKTSRKSKTHRIYVYKNDGSYESVRLPYSNYPNRCDIVDRAQDAERNNKRLIGVFRETFYPYYDLEFIKYKN